MRSKGGKGNADATVLRISQHKKPRILKHHPDIASKAFVFPPKLVAYEVCLILIARHAQAQSMRRAELAESLQ